MEHFVARQPILGRKQEVFVYELLFRSGLENYFDHVNGDEASSRVIANSFLLFGIESLTSHTRAFINFTREVLLQGFATVLPSRWTVVEVLENVEPDDQVIAACRHLKEKGFLLALDDFIYHEKLKPLIEMADIVKVDFLASQGEERARLARMCQEHGIRALAEKVETREDFEQALALGYDYFQGYFFSRPVIVQGRDIPGFKMHYLRILQAVNTPDMDFHEVGRLIESEVSIAYKLLKLVNSAAFGVRRKVGSIPQALTLLGQDEIRKWISLLSLSGMADDKPAELIVLSLVRAKFCEIMGADMGCTGRCHDYFLMGLFSLIDAVMDRPMAEILAEIPLPDHVCAALLQNDTPMRGLLDLAVAYERGEWGRVAGLAAGMNLNEPHIAEAYLEAHQWSRELFST